MTANVRKIEQVALREVVGSASAAASETAPRMPAQPMIVRRLPVAAPGALCLAAVERADHEHERVLPQPAG